MDPSLEMRNELLAKKIIKGLEKRRMAGYFCKTADEAIKKALEIVPEGSSITWGGTMTVRDMGLAKAFVDGNYDVFERESCKDAESLQEGLKKAFFMDWYVSSANAISEDGEIVNIDGKGNRIAAISFGPKKVLFIIGLNKVASDLESAIKRARSTAAPINAMRFDITTPCHIDGTCHNCNSAECICSYVHITRGSLVPDRIKVILVGENLGY